MLYISSLSKWKHFPNCFGLWDTIAFFTELIPESLWILFSFVLNRSKTFPRRYCRIAAFYENNKITKLIFKMKSMSRLNKQKAFCAFTSYLIRVYNIDFLSISFCFGSITLIEVMFKLMVFFFFFLLDDSYFQQVLILVSHFIVIKRGLLLRYFLVTLFLPIFVNKIFIITDVKHLRFSQ